MKNKKVIGVAAIVAVLAFAVISGNTRQAIADVASRAFGKGGLPIPPAGMLIAGSDGTNLQYQLMDTGGRPFVRLFGAGGAVEPFNGASPFFNDNVTTVVQVKGTKAWLHELDLVNTTAAVAYVQIFFKPSASVTLGTTAPDLIVRLPANASKTLAWPFGVTLSAGTGLSFAATTTTNGAVTAAVSVVAAFI